MPHPPSSPLPPLLYVSNFLRTRGLRQYAQHISRPSIWTTVYVNTNTGQVPYACLSIHPQSQAARLGSISLGFLTQCPLGHDLKIFI
ncbi:hypothetical protein HYPSUDRAFT_483957 [Hypholoma sublateritium FD-334 SS-4]|nr:hypothetical protein HYPSUDRAFT_483957 [Hypholoma sublateritium FD-334 SS-4]